MSVLVCPARLLAALSALLLVQCHSRVRRAPVLQNPPDHDGTGRDFVVFKKETSDSEMDKLLTTISKVAEGNKIYSVTRKVSKAITVGLSPYALEMVRQMPEVDYVAEEGYAVGAQFPPEWHLDRLDQVLPTLDYSYWPIGDGGGVDVYILDSGINYNHEEFGNRAKYPGKDPTDDYNANFAPTTQRQHGLDCHGHGTHVASLCGGKTFGAAKKVTLYSVRVLGCNNAGPWGVVLEGVDFVVDMVEKTNRPSIMSMSFSGSHYPMMDEAVADALRRGVLSVVAAGNGKRDSCFRSPAGSSDVLTVAGTRRGDGLHLLGPGTNFGRCVDIFAPGERVRAADHSCNNCSKILSGTSMSTPLVTGLAAIMLGREPLLSGTKLKEKLVEQSIKGAVDYTGIPDSMRDITPNRLAVVTGSCGEKESRFGHFVITSPNFPKPYPPNLDCRWEIGAVRGIPVRIQIHVEYLHLEPHHDVVRVFDGCCEDHDNMLRELTGNLRDVNFSFNSTGSLICIQLLTDGTISAEGFNATYTKYYAGTDLVVPDPDIPPPPQDVPIDNHVTLAMSPRQARDSMSMLMGNGYKLTWISSYRLGPDMNPYFDFVATNDTYVDTMSYVEIGYSRLNRTIQDMEMRGYYVKLLIDRIRGRNPSEPSYSVIFERRNSILETEVFLRDSYEEYISRLNTKQAAGYRLLSLSFCSIRNSVEVATVFTRDRRIAHNIPVPPAPALEARNNMTFFQFTTTTLRFANKNYFPSAVEVFTQGQRTDSYFSVIYEQRDSDTHGNWFRWSVNTTAARALIAQVTATTWDVYLTVGYTYLGKTEHFIEFQRK